MIDTLLVIVSITTLYEAITELFEESESSLIIWGWNKIENNPPKSVPTVSAVIGGIFFTIIINTIIGTIKSTKEILNVFSIDSIKNDIRSLLLTQRGERVMQPFLGMNIGDFYLNR